MSMVFFQLMPLFFGLIVVPILMARRKSGVSTWFPAQIMALFGLVAGIVIRHHGAETFLQGQPPLLVPTLATGVALVLAAYILK